MSGTLTVAIIRACRRFGSRPALLEGDRMLTYDEFGAAVASLARVYQQTLGITPGDRIVCRLPNCSELLIAAAAAWSCRAVHVGLPKDLTNEEFRAVAEQAHASAAVMAEPIRHDSDRSPSDVRGRGPSDAVWVVSNPLVHGGRRQEFWELVAAGGHLGGENRAGRAADPAVMFFTSGTAGRPKAVIHEHGRLLKSWMRYAALLEAFEEDTHMGHLPQWHAFGLGMAIACLSTGGGLVLVERFSPRTVLQLVDRHGITVFNGTPTHFRMLFDCLSPSRHDLSSLRAGVGSGGLFDRRLLTQIFERLKLHLVLVYGSTEGFGCRTTDRAEMLRGSVGRPILGSVAILDDVGREVPVSTPGEVAFRRDGPSAILSSAAWYRTGDLGKLDHDGHLYLLGRTGDQINRGGEKINPEEIEAVLSAHPRIDDSAVVPRADSVLGDVVVAVIVPAGNACPSLQEVRRFLARKLANHKLPDEVQIVDAIPRNPLGKVNRRALGRQER